MYTVFSTHEGFLVIDVSGKKTDADIIKEFGPVSGKIDAEATDAIKFDGAKLSKKTKEESDLGAQEEKEQRADGIKKATTLEELKTGICSYLGI
jgi:hypothetical protein